MNYKGLFYMPKEVILLLVKVISFTPFFLEKSKSKIIQKKGGCLKKTAPKTKTKKKLFSKDFI